MGVHAGLFRSGWQSAAVEELKLQDQNGKVRKVVLKYLQRALTTEIGTSHTPCVTSTKQSYNEALVDTSTLFLREAKVTFNKREWMTICENPEEGLMRRVLAQMDALLRNVDEELMARLIAKSGANVVHAAGAVPDVSDVLDYKTLNITDTNRMPQWAPVDELHEDIAENEWDDCTPAILFNNKGAFASYLRAQKIGCCNNSGVDVMKLTQEIGYAPYMAKSVEKGFLSAGLIAADAKDAVLLMNPGSAHLIEVWDNEHDNYRHGEMATTLWQDPFSQEKLDFEVQFDRCTKDYIVTMYVQKDVFGMPTDQFKATDPLANTNGIMVYKLTRG